MVSRFLRQALKDKLKNWLSRKTTSNNFIPEIDGFRFYAIFTVLLYHLNTHVSRVISSDGISIDYKDSLVFKVAHEGGIGVNVFFAISGFILALPFAKQRLFDTKPVSLKSYYIRRLTRLEPPYVISLVLLLGVHVIVLHENFNSIFPNFLASLFYIHNILFDQWSVINPVAWSLEVEVQFYVLAPVLAMLFSIRNPGTRRIVLLLLIVGSMLHYNLNYDMIQALHLRKSIFMHLHQFLVGFLFADFYLTDWKETVKIKSYGYDLFGIGSLLLLLIFNDPFVFYHDLIFAASLFFSFVSLFKGKLVNAFFTNTWIVIIGGMCYSIYLLHYAMIAFLAERSKILFLPDLGYTANFIIQLLVIIPIVLVVSAVYFALIERPCMDKDWPAKLKAKISSVL